MTEDDEEEAIEGEAEVCVEFTGEANPARGWIARASVRAFCSCAAAASALALAIDSCTDRALADTFPPADAPDWAGSDDVGVES